MTGTSDHKRKRNAAATRQAILESAIDAFARLGYDGAGVREIASNAGVTAMLVNRYFGSKEQLFAEAVDVAFGPPTVVAEEPEELSREMAEALVRLTDPQAEALGPFLIMLRSASSAEASEIVRRGIEQNVGSRLTEMLSGEDSQVRAELALAVIAGVWLMRKVIATKGLASADRDDLLEDLVRVFGAIVDP